MDRLDTPDKVQTFVQTKPYCSSVDIAEYFDAMGMVIIVKVTLWTKIRCLLSQNFYRSIKNELEVHIARHVPLGLDYKLIFEL